MDRETRQYLKGRIEESRLIMNLLVTRLQDANAMIALPDEVSHLERAIEKANAATLELLLFDCDLST